MKKDLKGMELKDLETCYKNSQRAILKIQAALLRSVSSSLKNILIQPSIEEGSDFLNKITDHTSQISVNLKQSKLAGELQRNNKELIGLKNELKARRKALFDTLDIEKIDLLSLSDIKSFLEKQSGERSRENHSNVDYKLNIKDIKNDTPIINLDYLDFRCVNCLIPVDIKTYGDLVKFWKEKGPKQLLMLRNFGQKSFKQVENLLREHGDIK